MRRPLRVAVLLGTVAVFAVVSLGIARVLAANGSENGAMEDLVAAEARGDARALRRLVTCDGGCAALAGRLRRSGKADVLNIDPSTRFALAEVHGTTRVAWRGAGLPVVQCVKFVRRGDVLAGFTSRLVSVTAPIPREGSCG